MITKLVISGLPVMHLTHDANDGEQFLQYIVTFVHHITLKTSMASLMWKQPFSPPPKKGIQRNAISEEVRGSVL
jgi:hypothetical protein